MGTGSIASTPSVALADEPTANLNSQMGKNLLESWMNEKKDDRVMDHARRLVMIRNGRVKRILLSRCVQDVP
jgi:ABC-type ATPase involved in cell division